jgi:hypothetical protein
MADPIEPIDPADLVYDLTVPACGRIWRVPRANKLTRRVEQSFGPVLVVAGRLRQMAVTTAELARLIHLLIEDQPRAPDLDAVEAWLFREGSIAVGPALAGELLTLIAGNAAVGEMQRERARAEREAGIKPPAEAGGERGPFAPTGA